MHSDRVGVVDFPTLGDLHDAWIERHCRIPDGFKRRRPFVEYDRQFWVTANRGRIREDVVFDPEDPPLNQAFTYRRVEVIDGQKVGKGPWAACVAALMACGPDEFGGGGGGGRRVRVRGPRVSVRLVLRVRAWGADGCPASVAAGAVPGDE